MPRHVLDGVAGSTDVRTVRMALAAKGVASGHVPVDIRQGENRAPEAETLFADAPNLERGRDAMQQRPSFTATAA